jgi:hypothetical protein
MDLKNFLHGSITSLGIRWEDLWELLYIQECKYLPILYTIF